MTGAKVKSPDGTITQVVGFDTDLKLWFCYIRGAKCFINGNDWSSAEGLENNEDWGKKQWKEKFSAILQKPIDWHNTKELVDDLWLFLTSNKMPREANITQEAFCHEVSGMIDAVRERFSESDLSEKLKEKAIEALLRSDNVDTPYLSIGKKSYTRRELANDIKEGTDHGIGVLNNLLQLTIDLMSRKKISDTAAYAKGNSIEQKWAIRFKIQRKMPFDDIILTDDAQKELLIDLSTMFDLVQANRIWDAAQSRRDFEHDPNPPPATMFKAPFEKKQYFKEQFNIDLP